MSSDRWSFSKWALRLALAMAAASVFVWAFADTRFRDDEGFLDGRICLPFTGGICLLLLAAVVHTRWIRFGLWVAVALLGQAVALQLIDAGPRLHYQHYRPFGELLKENGLLMALVAVQAVFVAAGLLRRWPTSHQIIKRTFGFGRLWGVLFVVLSVGVPVARHVPTFVGEIVFAASIVIVNLGTIFLALSSYASVPPMENVGVLLRGWQTGDGPSRPIRIVPLAVCGGCLTMAAAALLNIVSYERHPHVEDEVVYLQHARMLAQGALTMPGPPAQAPFDLYLMAFEGDHWYAAPPPGWPAVLALGVLAGVPWLVNPVLCGLNTFLATLLVRRLYNDRTALIFLGLIIVSPWHLFMGMNYMNHCLVMSFALLAALALFRAASTKRGRWALLSGMATGYLSLIRPLEGLIMACLLGLRAIGVGGQRLKAAAIPAYVLGVALVGSLVLPYNTHLTGQPTRFPIMAYVDEHYGEGSNAFGFGVDRGMDWPLDPYPGHGLRDMVVNNNLNLFSLNIELLGWPTGSLLLLVVMVFYGRWCRADRMMGGVIVSVIGAHCFYWFSGGPDFGARYWYLILVPCLVLCVRGMHILSDRLANVTQHSTRIVSIGVACLSGIALVNYLPWRAIDKYHHYLNMRPDVRRLSVAHAFGRSLVLIQGDHHPDYASAAPYNPLDFQADVPIFAWDRSPEARADALAAYPDRPVWIVKGPTKTGRGFEVASGPHAAADLADQTP